MKNKAKILLVSMAVIGLSAFTVISNIDHLAKPKQVEGINMYVMCEPVDEYYKLGQVGSGTSGQMATMLKNVAKNAKTQYPDAEGVIFDEVKGVGFAIQFKKK